MTAITKLKRCLSILLVLCMVLQYVPMAGFAATEDNLCEHHPEHTAECAYVEGENECTFRCDVCSEHTTTVETGDEYDIIGGFCGDAAIWEFDSNTGTLTISGTGEMYDYDDSGFNQPWYEYRASIISIAVAEGIEAIGANAFYGCGEALSISLPESLTDIGHHAFVWCVGITEINLPSKLQTIGEGTFDYCCNLVSVELPETITVIEKETFMHCGSLQVVRFPSALVSIGNHAFYDCVALTDVVFPESLTSIGESAFYGCSSISHLVFENVEVIGDYAFDYCEGLHHITLSSKIKKIGSSVVFCLSDLYFDGTEEEWNKVECNEYNTAIQNANIHFNNGYFAEGVGSPEDPYQVSNATELDAVRYDMTPNTYYLQVSDIDLSGRNWVPIGKVPDEELPHLFYGIYDGNGYVIENMSISAVAQGNHQCGLFGNNTGILKNIYLSDMSISITGKCNSLNGVNVGGIAGGASGGEISNCTTSGSIEVYTDYYVAAGGIVGCGTCSNCVNYATISVQAMADSGYATAFQCGGIAGYPGTITAEIKNCVNYGSVSITEIGDHDYDCAEKIALAGGIVGEFGTLRNCVNFGNVSSVLCNSCNSVAGGIVGRAYTWDNNYLGMLDNCYNLGKNIHANRRRFIVIDLDTYEELIDSHTNVGAIFGTGYDGDGYYTLGVPGCYTIDTVVLSDTTPDDIPDDIDVCGADGTRLSAREINLKIKDIMLSLGLPWDSNVGDENESENDTIVGGKCGDNIIWSYSSSDSTLTIEGTGKMYDFAEEQAPWWSLREEIKSVIISYGITSIGAHAFAFCTNINSFSYYDTLTAIGAFAFYGCSSLRNFPIIDSISTIGNYAFYKCTDLQFVTISGPVTTIGDYVFYGCTSLQTISLPRTLNSIGNYAFSECNGLIEAFYDGTEAQWSQVSIGSNNEDLTEALNFEPTFHVFITPGTLSTTPAHAYYQFKVTIENNSSIESLTNVSCSLNPGTSATSTSGSLIQNVDVLETESSTEFSWIIQIDRNEYPSGGIHYYDVIADSDQLEAITVTGSVALKEIGNNNNELDFDTDVWSFGNWSDKSGSKITDEHRNVLLAGLTPSEAAAVAHNNICKVGHCYGMSTTVILDKMGVVNMSEFTGTDNLRDAQRDQNSTHSILCYYQILQSLHGPREDSQKYLAMPIEKQLMLLAEKADAVKSGSSPVLFTFGSNKGSHAVVAYALETGSFPSPSESGYTYNHRVLLYDSNADKLNLGIFPGDVEWSEDYCFLFNDENSDRPWAWEIPAYANNDYGFYSDYPSAKLIRCTNDLNVIDAKNYTASLANYTAELAINYVADIVLTNTTSGDSWVISGSSGQVSGDSQLITYYTSAADDDEPGDLHIVLPDENAEYTITTLSGDREELNATILFDDKYVSISSTAATGARFSAAGDAAITDNGNSFEIVIADDTQSVNEFNTYTITGENTGTIVAELIDSSLSVSGNNLTGVSITASEGEISDSLIIQDAVDKVEMGRTDDSILIYDSQQHEHLVESSLWVSDENNHWHTCTGCGEILDLTAHSGGTATCAEDAICIICNTGYGAKNPDNHSGVTEIQNRKPATESEDGYTGDTVCECGTILEYGVVIPAIGDSNTISGTVASYGVETDEITVALVDINGNIVATFAAAGNSTAYSFSTIPSGTYILQVSKANHVGYSWEITVDDTDVSFDAAIYLVGDVTGDGKVTATDYSRLLAHVKKTSLITDDYMLLRADVTGDGKITATDYSRLLAHVKKVAPLW